MLKLTNTERGVYVQGLLHPHKTMFVFNRLMQAYLQSTTSSTRRALIDLQKAIEDKYGAEVSFGALRKYADGTTRTPNSVTLAAIAGTLLDLPK